MLSIRQNGLLLTAILMLSACAYIPEHSHEHTYERPLPTVEKVRTR